MKVMNGWIPITEDLPTPGAEVLVIRIRMYGVDKALKERLREGAFVPEQVSAQILRSMGITHWQPMPEFPECDNAG